MFSKLKSLQALLLFLCLSMAIVSCGDDDSSTSPTISKKISINLDDNIYGKPLSIAVPYTATGSQSVQAYLGDFHRDNFIAGLIETKINGEPAQALILESGISTDNRFDAYKNLDYNNLECNPEDLARSKSYVRFFVVENDKKVKELVLASNDREYQIYFWSETGTAKGIETPYKVDYKVEKGWNITEKTDKNLIIIPNLMGEIKLRDK